MILLKTKSIKYHNGTYAATTNIFIEIPYLCPICGVSNNPVTSHLNISPYEKSSIIFYRHQCSGCSKLFFTTQMVEDRKGTLINQYPESKKRTFDDLIIQMSPRFVELYNQSESSENKNHIDLAGMGYRASLEVLIKDYALHFQLDSKESIAKLNLNNAIGKYFNGDESIIPADVVRKLGNDYAHWEKEHNDLPLSVLKTYLEIFIKQIEVKLMLKYPPVSTRTP